jgi:aminoglycoside phosphotransferase
VSTESAGLGAAVPPRVLAVAAGRPVRLVWENELGGLTFEVGQDPDRCFMKWAPTAAGFDFAGEAARLVWARPFTSVPRLISHGRDTTEEWLVTAALPGSCAVADKWKAKPGTAVRAIGEGLRAMHNALPVDACPFSWRAADRLAEARHRASAGRIDPAAWDTVHQPLSTDQALGILAEIPSEDQLVVCHGDSCAPNTLLADDGRWSAHVDLGDLGVADRWADLAIATWSTGWNYGPGWEPILLEAYGIAPDPERTRYYRLLWDLGP